ncbi:Radical SAM superfamily enzyme, MoaA/NifB/PqqE/SkfB family [Anaerocolumna jejuensis DSM 15929]|uniref:Radical SAM superfamily enzyme, MoaA/NifB/PqqE/SkfB family n=1 Tax=Anaerocolumna jejuensis DSM 15929 TaxID=1121322 RepID=A0A1M7AM76_9FIRM|nr:radical SAM protein [Anaerocolumna jejuensis]SHL43606.1 Radical SAM superfamily enzyme, MoaA/NifB/PqqE/SkfB family [Anaerocolumna jejuensis DSM 15929]
MKRKSIKEAIQGYGIKKAVYYLDSNPEKNIPKVLNWLIKIDKEEKYVAKQAKVILPYMDNKNNNWYRLIKSLYTDVDDGVRKKLFENFIVNGVFIGGKRQNKARKEYQCNVPWAILLDPTSGCNLHCIGCWSAEYGDKLNMDFDTLDSIITQGKELGIYFYVYSGGEPLIRKKDIIRLCEKHQDCAFLAFTNGTLINDEFAQEMLRVKNFVPAISVEGFQEETDYRRGKGTFLATEKAMELLRAKKLPFGISCCYTSKNTEVIGSEEYFDFMVGKGAKFAWFFTYMPVGKDAVPELLAKAEQREFIYRQIRHFRESKPIFTIDFWNDGEYVKGCIAGGRRYLHINANGDIEPCAFIHYSDSNVYEKSILEALKSPLFMEYHKNQPFHANLLRPCPLLDNQGRLAEMVERSGAKSTDLKNPEEVGSLTEKCIPAADRWEPVADRLWKESHGCRNCNGCLNKAALFYEEQDEVK